jgi:hypothetical protein
MTSDGVWPVETTCDAGGRHSSIESGTALTNTFPAPSFFPFEEVVVDDKQLAKLIRKNVAKVEKATKAKQTRKYDPTLAATRGTTEEDGDVEVEREQFFKEMKRREF